MTETLSTSKEVPKTKLALQEKYDQEKKEEPHAKINLINLGAK